MRRFDQSKNSSGIGEIIVADSICGSESEKKLFGMDYYLVAARFQQHSSSYHHQFICKEAEDSSNLEYVAYSYEMMGNLLDYSESMEQLPTHSLYVYEAFKIGIFTIRHNQGNFT